MGKIIDQFTDLKISRQSKWQARHRAAGLCIECGDKLVSKSYCKYHHLKHYLRTRARAKPLTVRRQSIGAQLWVEALRAQKINEPNHHHH
jgi:hypothetical protein